MPDLPLALWARRGVLVLLSTLLLVSSIGLTDSFLEPIVSILKGQSVPWSARFSSDASYRTPAWVSSLGPAEERTNHPISRLALTLEGKTKDGAIASISAKYEIWLPKDHPALESARNLTNRDEVSSFVTDVLGNVSVDSRTLFERLPEIESLENQPEAHIKFASELTDRLPQFSAFVAIQSPIPTPVFPRRRSATAQPMFPLPDTRVAVKTDGLRVTRAGEPPVSQTQSETVLNKRAQGALYFDLQVPDTDTQSQRPGNYRRVFENILSFSSYRGVQLIPTLLMLLWLMTHPQGVGAAQSRMRALAILVVAMLATDLSIIFVSTISNETGTLASLSKLVFSHVEVFKDKYFRNDSIVIVLALALVGWPLVMRDLASPVHQPKVERAWLGILWWGFCFGLALVAWFIGTRWAVRFPEPDRVLFWVTLLVPTLPLTGITSALLLRAIGRRRSPVVSSLAMLLAVLAIATLLNIADSSPDSRLAPAMWFAVFMLCGVPFVVAFSSFVRLMATGQAGKTAWFPLIASVAVVLVLPLFAAQDMYAPVPVDIWNLVPEVARLGTFCLAGLIVRWMRDDVTLEGWPRSSNAALAAGLALALSFLFSTGSWKEVLIQVSAGYVMLRWVLFVSPEVPEGFQVRPEHWKTVIDQTIRCNEIGRVARSLKKDLLSKLAKGDITHLTYRTKLEPIEQELQVETTKVSVHDAQSVLRFGPSAAAWENAKIALAYGLAIASPWILLSLADLSRPEGDWYGLLPVLNSALNIAARWTLLALFFGYFYPYIRGRSGIQKAFWTCLTVVTPAALATAVFSPSWKGLSFWALQVLITSMLLGVAMDIETLRSARHRARDLVEVHNIGALSAWASTVILALGTTVATILSSGIGNLVTAALQYAGLIPKQPK